MAGLTGGRLLTGAVLAGAAFSLAACNGITYGTGVSPGMQTLKDIAGITALTDKKKPIDYEERPPVVAPPAAATDLPPPGSDNTTVASDWPLDPDQKEAKLKADVAALEKQGKHLQVKLPQGAAAPKDPYADMTPAERSALVRKLAKEARANLAVDQNGDPVRRYLSEPPVDYRVGDLTAPPPNPDDKKKKKKWWKFWASNDTASDTTASTETDTTASTDADTTAGTSTQ